MPVCNTIVFIPCCKQGGSFLRYAKELCCFGRSNGQKNGISLVLFLLGFFPLSSPAAISITETAQLSFGLLEIPLSGTVDITIDQESGLASGSGIIIHDTASRGQYLLSATEGNGVFSLDIHNITTGSPALTLSQFKGHYGSQVISSFPSGTLAAPGSGTTLNLGAKLTYSAAVLEQSYNMYFDIVVNYE